MANCGFCNAKILFGGVQWSAWTCCDESCVTKLKQGLARELLGPADIEGETGKLHAGSCPRCGGGGPVDVYGTRKVTGMILAVSWSAEKHICCARCAKKERWKAALHCLALGWWSPKACVTNIFYLPFNCISALATQPSRRPSKALEEAYLEGFAEQNAHGIRKQMAQRAAADA